MIRGIGRVENGPLVDLAEVRDIARDAAGVLHGRFGTEVRPLTSHELASMNVWVFPKQALGELRGVFESFLREHGQAPKSESIIPEAVSTLMAQGTMRVRALSAPGPWFGLTHLEDRDGVRQGLQALTDKGVYTSPLWKQAKGQRGNEDALY